MVRTVAVLAAALVLLTGCGSEESRTRGASLATSPSASPSGSADACVAPSPGTFDTLGTADMDGDGTPDRVGTSTSAGCPPALAVDLGNGPVLAAPLPVEQPPVRSAFGVDLAGRQGSLLVTRQVHPRGGFQLRVYGLADGELAELRTEGRSLVPFVALDVQERPWSIDCADGGVVFTEAVASEPVGAKPAWDIRRTAYAVEGNEVTAGPTRRIADTVLPKQLAAKYPRLAQHSAFQSCRAAG